MQTTQIKYAIMDRVTGKLLTYYHSLKDEYHLESDQTQPTWFVEAMEDACSVVDGFGETALYGDYKHPVKDVDISPASHCVVKVTMVCDVEILK